MSATDPRTCPFGPTFVEDLAAKHGAKVRPYPNSSPGVSLRFANGRTLSLIWDSPERTGPQVGAGANTVEAWASDEPDPQTWLADSAVRVMAERLAG